MREREGRREKEREEETGWQERRRKGEKTVERNERK